LLVLSGVTKGLVNYWPVTANYSASDLVGVGNLTAVSGASLGSNRFGQANESIQMNSTSGHYFWQAPIGSYFTGDFSVSVWIYKRSCSAYQTIRNISIFFFLKFYITINFKKIIIKINQVSFNNAGYAQRVYLSSSVNGACSHRAHIDSSITSSASSPPINVFINLLIFDC
jgi:hypothetical protein